MGKCRPVPSNLVEIKPQKCADRKSNICSDVLRNSRLDILVLYRCTLTLDHSCLCEALWIPCDLLSDAVNDVWLMVVTISSVDPCHSYRRRSCSVSAWPLEGSEASSPQFVNRTDRESDRQTQWRHPSHQLCVCFSFIVSVQQIMIQTRRCVETSESGCKAECVFSCSSRLKGTSEAAENQLLSHSHSHFDDDILL